jgi:hypothetical protein
MSRLTVSDDGYTVFVQEKDKICKCCTTLSSIVICSDCNSLCRIDELYMGKCKQCQPILKCTTCDYLHYASENLYGRCTACAHRLYRRMICIACGTSGTTKKKKYCSSCTSGAKINTTYNLCSVSVACTNCNNMRAFNITLGSICLYCLERKCTSCKSIINQFNHQNNICNECNHHYRSSAA